MRNKTESFYFWKYGPGIKNIYIENEINEIEDYAYKFDVTEEQNGRVMAYLVERKEDSICRYEGDDGFWHEIECYDLYLQADGIIYPNEDASYYFAETYTLEAIYNLEGLDTSNVTNMSSMFFRVGYNSTNFSLDLSNFDTSKVTNMEGMFELTGYSNSDFILDVSNFDTSNVKNMSWMFYETGYNSTKLNTSITIKNPNITSYDSMFYNVATKEGSQITVNYTSKTSSLVDKMIATKSEGSNVVKGDLVEIITDDIDVGDEIAIDSEHFYVISNDETNTTLLVKYNLEVGSNCIYNSGYQCTEIENPSGIQNEKALGYTQTGDTTTGNYGVVPFSSTEYWYDSSTDYLKTSYGSSYPAYVYDDNASIKTYVDNYKTYLESIGVVVNSARLIKQEELVELGCSENDYTCTTTDYEWLYTTSYWSGSGDYDGDVWAVRSDGHFGVSWSRYSTSTVSGVRPVITISKDTLKNLNTL